MNTASVASEPMTQKLHGTIAANISRILGNYTFKSGFGLCASNDAGIFLDCDQNTVRGPDIAVYDDTQHSEALARNAESPPILAVEVLSPTDRASRLMKTLHDYLMNGVAMVWWVNPARRSVSVFMRDYGPRVFDERQALTGGDVLPGLKCKVAEFFRLPGDKAKPPKKRKS